MKRIKQINQRMVANDWNAIHSQIRERQAQCATIAHNKGKEKIQTCALIKLCTNIRNF